MKVVVVEDDPMLRAAFVTALTHHGIEVAGSAETTDEAIALIDAHAPDVVTLDLRLIKEAQPADAGLRIAERVRLLYPEVALLVVATDPQVEHVKRLMALEPPLSVGLMAKGNLGDMGLITDAMHRVVKGQVVIDPGWIRELLVPKPRPTDGSADSLARLTPRERQILSLVASGLTNLAIAQKLECTLGNVERNLSTIFGKLGLASEAEQRRLNRRVVATLMYLRAENPQER
ncbi:response regulator transcription factor [Streptomyces filipinensis]|uniref:response regulator transcription factor n=1 Tax=Streptomyces filipinensis TaxID=66887 RepID=UPI0036E87989